MIRTRLLLTLVVSLSLASCAPEPDGDFVELDSGGIPQDKAALYLFRTATLFDGSSACNTTVGNRTIGALMPGEYTVVLADPGKTRIETDGPFRAFVTVTIHAGEPTFIRQEWRFRNSGILPGLSHLPETAALELIRSCNFVETPPVLGHAEDEAAPPEGGKSAAGVGTRTGVRSRVRAAGRCP